MTTTTFTPGDWIRAYATSLRGPGESIEIGEIVQFTEIKNNYSGKVEERGILIKNAQFGAVVRESAVIEVIDPVALWNENWPGEPLRSIWWSGKSGRGEVRRIE